MTRSVKNTNKSFYRVLLWPFKSYIRIIIVVGIIGLFQYQSIEIDILAREIRTLEMKKKQLLNEKTVLQVEIDRLTHLNRIEKLAREKYGLISTNEEMPKLMVKKFDTESADNVNDVKLAGVQ